MYYISNDYFFNFKINRYLKVNIPLKYLRALLYNKIMYERLEIHYKNLVNAISSCIAYKIIFLYNIKDNH